MFTEQIEEAMRILLQELQDAFAIQKGKHALKAAQNAYMKAARAVRDIERTRVIPMKGSQE